MEFCRHKTTKEGYNFSIDYFRRLVYLSDTETNEIISTQKLETFGQYYEF